MAKTVDFKQTKQDMLDINKGLKEVISYQTELGQLKRKYNDANEREADLLSDVLDKTKDIMKNRKSMTEEQLNTVDLHKLERRLIAEGLEDQVQFVQKLKQEHNIQKQINREVNAQAKMYESIGSSIDGFIKSIPGIGGILSDVLGTADLGKEMSEGFRTELARAGGGSGFFSGAGQEFAGGFGTSLFTRRRGGSESRNAVKNFFGSGLRGALGLTALVAATAGLFSRAMSQGFEAVGVKNTLKRLFFGSAFDGLKDAFGNMGQANLRTLMAMRLNRFRFGISESDQSKILAAQVNISGATKQTALNIQQGIARSAALRGVLPADVFQDIANNTEMFAQFAQDGGENLGEAAIKARQLGISLDTVSKITDSVLDFQSSIENELQASLLIGRQLNLNRARELAMVGDIAGLQDEIVKQIGSEAELQQMNAIQRKKLAGALGITVSELNRLASGEMEIKNSDMKQNTDAIKGLTVALAIATAGLGARLLGQGLQYAGSLFTKGGFKALGNQAPVGGVQIGNKFYKGGQFLPMAVRGKPAGLASAPGMAGTSLIGRAGQVGLIVAAIAGVTALVRGIAGTSKETADNTRKSVADKNFVSSPFISSTVLQRDNRVG